MTDLAKLVVKLEAQTAQYMNALDAAEKRLKKFDKQAVSLSGVGQAAATVAIAAATAIATMGKQAIDAADNLNDLSKSTGMTTEFLSQMEFAAKQSGIDLETLAKSFNVLSRNQVAAAKGSKAQVEAFEAIGVSVADANGQLRDSEEVLLDVADKFSQYEDGAAKAAVAQAIFGKSGAALIPFLNEGRSGLEKMAAEADKLGLTISGNTAKAADEFNDNLGRLSGGAKGLVNRLVEQVLPTMVEITNGFIESAQAGGALDFAVQALAVTFKAFVTAGVIVKSIFQQLGRAIYGAAAALVKVSQGEFSAAADEIKFAFADMKDNVANDVDTIAKVWGDAVPKVEQAADGMDKALKKTIIFSDTKAKEAAEKAVQAALDALAGLEQGLMQQVDTFGMTEAQIMKYRVTLGDLAATLDAAGEKGAIYRETIIALSEQLEKLNQEEERRKEILAEMNALQNEAMSVAESVLTPLEKYENQIARLNVLLEKGVLTQELYNRAVRKAQDELEKADKETNQFLKRAQKNIQDIIADGLGDALHEGVKKGAKGALDAFVDMLEKMVLEAIAADITAAIFGEKDKSGNAGSGIWDAIFGRNKSQIPGTGGIGGGNPSGGSGGGWWDTAISFLGSFFGGSRDSGGRGQADKAYRIGIDEEWFVPDRPGLFMTPEQMGGRGGKVTQNIYMQGQATERSVRQMEIEAARRQRIATTRLG